LTPTHRLQARIPSTNSIPVGRHRLSAADTPCGAMPIQADEKEPGMYGMLIWTIINNRNLVTFVKNPDYINLLYRLVSSSGYWTKLGGRDGFFYANGIMTQSPNN
jgi:hypothetical protein